MNTEGEPVNISRQEDRSMQWFEEEAGLVSARFEDKYYDEFKHDYEKIIENVCQTPGEYSELQSFSERAEVSTLLLAWYAQQHPQQPDYIVRETNQELKPLVGVARLHAGIELGAEGQQSLRYYLSRKTIGGQSFQETLGYIVPKPFKDEEFSITTDVESPTTYPLPLGYRNSNFITKLMDIVSVEIISTEVASTYNRVNEEYEKKYGKSLE